LSTMINKLLITHPGSEKLLYPAALLSACLLIAAFPPFEQGYIAWVALIPFIYYSLKTDPRRSFKAGILFGATFHLYVNFYLTNVLFSYLSLPLALAAMILLIFYLSLYSGLFALSVNLVNRLGRPWFTALAIPTLWLLTEYLRSLTFLAYNVGYLGYTQWQYPGLLNLASVYGYWGLPFLMVLFQVIILLIPGRALKNTPLFRIIIIFTILMTAGLLLPSSLPLYKDEEPLQVSLIQGNTSPEQVLAGSQTIMDLYLNLTGQAAQNETDLVVWPETVATLNFTSGRSHPADLVKTADELGVSILYGARTKIDGIRYNSIAYYSQETADTPLYHKIRLVPFVEFFPAEELLNRMLQLELLLGSLTPGEEITIFEIKNKPLAGVICFESYFGDHTRLFAAKGAEHLFVLTNDAWFGCSIGLEQHAQAAAIRAAEMGIGVTQVANSGITISFDYRGRELFRTGKAMTETVNFTLDTTRRNTFYTRAGDYFPAFWALFLLVTIPVLLKGRVT
jgi:apolipoprotein N-acyltransferase